MLGKYHFNFPASTIQEGILEREVGTNVKKSHTQYELSMRNKEREIAD